MCVILVCEDMAPSLEILEACEEDNPQGGGIAWREKEMVCWEKGLGITTKDIYDRMKKVKLPYVIHYRIASQGGICSELCHPFPFGAADARLKGASKRGVVFHNGTLHSWKRDMKEAAVYSNTPIPSGRWSDSRAMAFMAGIYGQGFMELLDEKIVSFTPEEGPKIYGTLNQGWNFKKLDGDKGIWFSNDRWEKLAGSTNSGTSAGGNSGPVVGSFVGSHTRGGGNRGYVNNHSNVGSTAPVVGRPGVTDPRFAIEPWKKPADCDHKQGSYTHHNSMRFCGACGTRLDMVKDEPWITANPAPDDATPGGDPVAQAALLLAEAKGAAVNPNIAQRVKRLVLAASVREGK